MYNNDSIVIAVLFKNEALELLLQFLQIPGFCISIISVLNN